MCQYFSKPYIYFGENINVKVHLSICAMQAVLKDATGIDTSRLAAKSDLVSLKADIDKIDVDRLKNVPVDLSKLSVLVKNEVVKECVVS